MTRLISSFALIGFFLGTSFSPTASAQEKERKARKMLRAPSMEGMEFRDAATSSQLAEKLRQSRKTNPMDMGKLKVIALKEDPSKTHASKDFIQNSEVLCLNGSATFIPKRSVLNLPERFGDRLKLKKGSKIQTFQDFFIANRSWLLTYEVSIEQAFGKKPFDEKKLKWLKGSGRVVIATFKGGPITVLPYVEDKEVENSENDTAS